MPSGKTVGVLAMQGAYHKHSLMIESLGAEALEVRTAEDMSEIDALVIPGGESTVMSKLLARNGLIAPLRDRALNGMPVFGTCAGMILLAKDVDDFNLPLPGLMDISVHRNAYGRQLESFEASFSVEGLGDDPVTGIFIRAPKIIRCGPDVEILAEYEDIPVLVREKNFLAASFHPELTGDSRIHALFLSMIK
ncbi:MAG TPA: pyridoxal 5'-phosphate synthase glutaminase subunit PdxT [Spirochaetota bacterium]|nr:pyridoxal 5'-phosphate synthase glutaminase subunit PdxT [Spirochaetota bacterium]HPF07124.1 pyridoxal 5'-phosphate synthase glutaminase subunit PdxT [Spirochaetota bacterium]HPJ42135.1 pyridoxal 5'-phosphate synthase glutaminase subunit PdxT [Spirochaetota bacterium]HPR38486.1 pyridoxal 5'-phosphate synthase glutaminase subunit PdxT [Spirochaetota bacterium]HRX47545.1 pyridoxal 5'-phosphate synthase glutaminase subunit PdxT [Spirochaetota bacterium]